MSAGCIGYTRWIAGRHVADLGRRGDRHIARFPDRLLEPRTSRTDPGSALPVACAAWAPWSSHSPNWRRPDRRIRERGRGDTACEGAAA